MAKLDVRRRPLRKLVVASCFTVLTIQVPGAAHSQGFPQPDARTSLAPLIKGVMPAVVTVLVRGEKYKPYFLKNVTAAVLEKALSLTPKETFRAGGSGVIFDAQSGLIGTNNHVIEGSIEVHVGLIDGRTVAAKVLGSDHATDIAIIKIDAPNLTKVTLGNSDNLAVGDFVVAVGNPYGLDHSASFGIISALRRSEIGHGLIEDFVQIDAAINPGNSGGALVNLKGELIGITTAGDPKAPGIGFTVPINIARAVGRQILTHGKVQYGSVGILSESLTPDLAEARKLGIFHGALVKSVIPDSPAARAGVKVGDVTVSVMGKSVRSVGDLRPFALMPFGTEIPIEMITTGGESRKLSLKISELAYEPEPVSIPAGVLGLGGAAVVPISTGSHLFGQIRGIEVARVEAGSNASTLGLKQGDVITKIADRRVSTPSEALAVLAAKAKGFVFDLVRNRVPIRIEVGAP